MRVTFILPTLNNALEISNVLQSIRTQDYPSDKIEIVVSDGGSTDNTTQIALKYGCKVINNPKILAEYGISLGIKESSGDINIIVASDNELVGNDWITKMVRPFIESDVIGAFPETINSKSDSWISCYYNVFTDPFNHFIYGSSANTRTLYKEFNKIFESPEYIIYDFKAVGHPLLVLAQGFATSRDFNRPSEYEFDDIMPLVDLILKGKKLAFVPKTKIYHHTVKNLSHFIKKIRWASANGLNKKNYGFTIRTRYLTKWQKIKVYLWIPYSFSIIFPILRSIYGIIRDKEFIWRYHAPISFIGAGVVLYEFIRFKVFGINKIVKRQ
ncbi:MAG: glycosyltransferase [Nitrospirae bacterium]|nr:glycosyltransferase [Nitrospirota bacterium]